MDTVSWMNAFDYVNCLCQSTKIVFNLLEHCCCYYRDMCNLFHVLLQVYVYLKKKMSKILLFKCFILLYTTYRDRAIFVQGKKLGH